MPQNIGAVVKCFYMTVVIVTLWIGLCESRQQNLKDHNNNNNEAVGSKGGHDFLENGNSSRGGSHGGGGGGGGVGPRNGHRNGHRKKHNRRQNFDNADNDLSLWINEQQLKMLSGYAQGRIYAIEDGHVVHDIRDLHIFNYLTIPSEVNFVNFTWKSGGIKYFYHFDRLQTLDESILKAPTVSIKTKGRIPPEEKMFSVFLTCTGNNSGTAMFNVGLSIQNRRGKPLPGTPLRVNFKKECAHRGPDPECNLKCGNNGFCNHHKICQCKAGYTGQYCQTAFCFPQCMNGGNCTAPSVCTCPEGYQGTQCEGGICTEKCRNGGKCVQKDKCQCSKGYYGLHCEHSKCVVPCMNGGRCIGSNVCRCPNGLGGNHCEIGRKQRSTCKRPCKHGVCMPNKTCKCNAGFHGRFCNGRNKKHRQVHR